MKKNNDNMSARDVENQGSSGFHKFLFHNTGIKICSLIIAIIVWAVIINIDDPYKTRSFNVEVETINESALNSVNKVYEVIEGSTALVKVKGKKSVVDKLGSSDIRATADLSNLSVVNAVTIQPSLRMIPSSEVTLECGQVLRVLLEDRESKQVKVNVISSGIPGEGYTLGECTAKPNMIEVSGGESSVERITSVRVFLNVNGATEDFAKKLTPVAYDENGNKVESGTLSFSSGLVRVFAQILEDKAVPVKVKIMGKPANGYEYISTDCLPETVEIAGTSRKLSNISDIVIPVDITGMTTSSPKLEQDIYISDYLPLGVSAVEGSETVSIRITLEQVIKKNIEIDVKDIKFSAVSDGFGAEIIDNTDTASVLVSGRISILNGISGSSVTPFIDCDNLDEGVYSLPVSVEGLDKSCTVLDSNKLKVRIYKINHETKPPQDNSTEAPVSTMPPVENVENTEEPPLPEDGEETEDGTLE